MTKLKPKTPLRLGRKPPSSAGGLALPGHTDDSCLLAAARGRAAQAWRETPWRSNAAARGGAAQAWRKTPQRVVGGLEPKWLRMHAYIHTHIHTYYYYDYYDYDYDYDYYDYDYYDYDYYYYYYYIHTYIHT
jgi:hypothetical protein